MKINCKYWKECGLINGGCCSENKYAGKPSYGTCITVCEEYNGSQDPPPDEPVRRFILPKSNIKDFGFGDLIFYIFKITGINCLIKWLYRNKEDGCRCAKRRAALNQWLSYRKLFRILKWRKRKCLKN